MSVPEIYGPLRLKLRNLTILEAPREAVGIIYRDKVYSLKNIAENPENSFAVDVAELRSLVKHLAIDLRDVEKNVFFWHSHPGGGVGPSRFDMQNRTPLKHHLVVALVEDDIVPTWY